MSAHDRQLVAAHRAVAALASLAEHVHAAWDAQRLRPSVRAWDAQERDVLPFPRVERREVSEPRRPGVGPQAGTTRGQASVPAFSMAPTRKDTTVDDVVARARRGDRRALEVLVDQHLDQLYTVALRIVGSPADAEDVVQEAVVRIWQQLPTFRGDARFSTWAYRIVTNLALDQVRRPRYETAVADAPDVPLEDLEPARLVEVSTELDRVGVALAQLTPPQRAAIVLAELVGLPQEDIAEVLDTTVSGVKNRLYRARTRLRQLLDEVDDPGLR